MAETVRGKLVWQASGKERVRRVIFPTRKGMSQPTFFPPDQFAGPLGEATEDGIEVDLDLEQGKPLRIRPVGAAWTGAPAPARRSEPQGGPRGSRGRAAGHRGGGRDGGRERDDDRGRRSSGPAPEPGFHNPYNFIPAVQPVAGDGPLGQHAPSGHDRYREGRWSGRIDIRITTATPLLIPDAARAMPHPDNKDHLIFGIRKYHDEATNEDRPYLPPTSLKGALRSAYEAVTNSRMGVFAGHSTPLAHRMEARKGLAMIPARLSDDGETLDLWLGTSSLPAKRGEPMSAAWLPRYRKGAPGIAPWAVKYHGSGKLPEHGHEVVCWLELFRHARRGFTYWRVRSIAPATMGTGLPQPEPTDRPQGVHEPVRGQALLFAYGWVCVTNQNINTKHDERVFFVARGEAPKPVRPGKDRIGELQTYWRDLVRNYQDLHADELRKRAQAGRKASDYLGGEPGKTAWSRHVYEKDMKELQRGSLCYARLDDRSDIAALYPVMISRELAAVAPETLLPAAIGPARRGERQGEAEEEKRAAAKENKKHAVRFEQLSPADRVFGWASQKGGGAWRGQLRIGPVRCTSPASEAIESFDGDGLPLAILSTAKPQQARFYVAADKDGQAQARGLDKARASYTDKDCKGLRGRKTYPHHRRASATDGYWDSDGATRDAAFDIRSGDDENRQDRLNGNVFREHVRRYGHEIDRHGNRKALPNRDDQNRSITEWVAPETEFATWIDVINLGEEELGALLWLLSLDAFEQTNAGHFHRLGGGKPLGFGSVKIEIAGLDLADGEGKKTEYRSLVPLAGDQKVEPHFAFARDAEQAVALAGEKFVEPFKTALAAAYPDHGGGDGFAEVVFIKAFLAAARGFDDLPLHYPRNGRAPDPAGKNYEWFVGNEQTRRDAPDGNRLALGDLAGDPGLPYWGEG